MTVRFTALPTDRVRALQHGGPDAYGFTPERQVSDGDGVPCRHCLKNVEKGEAYLVLAYCPFSAFQPYAETGPIFLHAKACRRADDAHETPAMLARRMAHLIKGYSSDDRIVYGTGKIVPSAALDAEAANILKREDVAYVHVRSSVNNCYTCRIERA